MSTQDIVFDIGGLHFRSGLMDDHGVVSNLVTFDSPTHPIEFIEHIQRIVDSYTTIADDPLIGIALGGMVEKNGLVTSGAMNMFDFPLAERLNLRYPVTIVNDAKAAALAETTYNTRLAERNSFLLVTHSMGIGGGIIIDGNLYEGHTGTAGEIGHLIIDHGLDCYCRLGHRGCLDALASGRALDNRLKSLWREGHWTNYTNEVTLRDLHDLLASGDGMAQSLMREVGQWIGIGIMQIIRVLDPCEIVFKGYVANELWEYLAPQVADLLRSCERTIPLSLSALGENVGLVGAGIAARRMRDNLATQSAGQ